MQQKDESDSVKCYLNGSKIFDQMKAHRNHPSGLVAKLEQATTFNKLRLAVQQYTKDISKEIIFIRWAARVAFFISDQVTPNDILFRLAMALEEEINKIKVYDNFVDKAEPYSF